MDFFQVIGELDLLIDNGFSILDT